MRCADGHSSWTRRRFPWVLAIPEVSRHALDADWCHVSQGRWGDRTAAFEEAWQGVLRLLELPELRLRLLGQARCGDLPGVRLPGRRNEAEQDAWRVPPLPQVWQRMG